MSVTEHDRLIGRAVEIQSSGGVVYNGIVKSIRPDLGQGELFELGAADTPSYQRYVFVTNRAWQIREVDSAP